MKTQRILLYGLTALALFVGPPMPWMPSLVSEARAIVGAPVTPVSVAGVARRTTRRTVVATSSASAAAASSASASAAASQQQAAAAQQQAAAAQQQAAMAEADAAAARQEAALAQQQAAAAQQPAPGATLAVGTVISALPSGCNTLNIGGADYFNCAGTYYRAAFQSGQVVYVVSKP